MGTLDAAVPHRHTTRMKMCVYVLENEQESQQQKRQCRMWKHQDNSCHVGILHSSQQLSASFVLSEVKAHPPDCRSCLGLHARPSFLGFIRGSVRSVIFCGHHGPPQRVVCLLLTFPNPQHIAHTHQTRTLIHRVGAHSLDILPPPFTPLSTAISDDMVPS